MLWFEVQFSQPGGTARRVSCCGSTLYKLFDRPLVPALDSLGSLPCRKDGTEGSVSPICCQDSWLDLHGKNTKSDGNWPHPSVLNLWCITAALLAGHHPICRPQARYWTLAFFSMQGTVQGTGAKEANLTANQPPARADS